MTQTCPACGGAAMVVNPKTGNPLKCPVCNGAANIRDGLTDQLYAYLLSPAQLAGNQQGVLASFTTVNDSDFQIWWLMASSTGLFSCELFDSYAGNAPLQDAPVNSEIFFGTAQLPMRLPKPYPVYRGSTIKAKFNDRSGAANTIQVACWGYKIDKLPAAPAQ